MLKFASQEWLDEFVKILNANKAYEEAAATWEGDFLWILHPDETAYFTEEIVLYLDLWHGKCRHYEVLDSREARQTAFIYEGPYANWIKIVKGELDPIKALLTRRMKLTGDRPKVMRATRAAKELVRTSQLVETEF